ncbi:deoxycytidylate deaminase isoform X1 [Microplitis mediator]|uniref:deoxycytidylate deaminase isoform X1 n=2 Tax=Microplitis mediator TaxID=375433 RepID=UPI00255666AE|nr:deoxycytidylate deaminase isoform X1 [Microplitis mediator]XP_057329075.1 deoxycytidylate deaminase isoform X1 [Microplitis mediator]
MADNKETSQNGDINLDEKRVDYLEWDDYFMAIVFLSAERSKDPCTQVGACIVDQRKRIVAIGYNGMPMGCDDDKFPWGKDKEDRLKNKSTFVCHAEANAILNKNSFDVQNCAMYVGLFPCNECAKLIIQAGIKKIIYMSDKHAYKKSTIAAKMMFDAAFVEYRQYIPKRETVEIKFNKINWNEKDYLPLSP